MISLRFLGAAGTVTGSKYVLTVGPHKVLVDCGLFQGSRELTQRNWEALPEPAASFEAVVLTHAHIDHSGYLPRLVADGFRGKVLATPATLELCELLLLDSARLQQEEADYRNRHHLTRYQPALPLYTETDASAVIPHFTPVQYGKLTEVVPGVRVRFHDAGHILGSAWLELELTEPGLPPVRLVMSGDLGRENAPILRDPEPPVECDYLVVESTYGDHAHSLEPIGPRLAEVVMDNVRRRGVLVIPAFAVERAQELIYILGDLYARREIGRVPVFLDSPMAAQASRIFDRYRQYFDEQAAEEALLHGGLLHYRKLKICETIQQSRAIDRTQPPYVVISASGMATGGRVLHHLRRCLPDPRNTVLLVGFQVEGTRGWRLLNGAESLRIFGEEVPVRARVEVLDGFSGHADFRQVNRWLQSLRRPPRQVFLVHGEPNSLSAQKQRIEAWPGWSAHVPSPLETVALEYRSQEPGRRPP